VVAPQSGNRLRNGVCAYLGIVSLFAVPFWFECSEELSTSKPGDSAMGVVFGHLVAVLVWLHALSLECRRLSRDPGGSVTWSDKIVVLSLCLIYMALRLPSATGQEALYPNDTLFGLFSEILSGGGLAYVALRKTVQKPERTSSEHVTVLFVTFASGALLVWLPIRVVFRIGDWIR